MQTQDAIFARKSVRGYASVPVEEEKLDLILKAGNYAPIFGNIHMSVITDKELLDEINEAGRQAALASGNEFMIQRVSIPGYKLTYGAPVLIVLSAPEGEYGDVNCALAAENIILSATDLGLGTCYLAGFLAAFSYKPCLLEKILLPEGHKPVCGVIAGYEGGDPIPGVPRQTSDNITRIK